MLRRLRQRKLLWLSLLLIGITTSCIHAFKIPDRPKRDLCTVLVEGGEIIGVWCQPSDGSGGFEYRDDIGNLICHPADSELRLMNYIDELIRRLKKAKK